MSKKIFLVILLGLFLFNVSLVYGQGIIPKASNKNVPAGCADNAPAGVDAATYCGNYTLDDFVVLAINVSRWILGIVGSLALIMFIYGGFMFLISAGSSESITKARKIIVAAVIGLVIVFSSYLIIKFVLSSIGIDWNGQKIKVAAAPAANMIIES